MHRGYRMFGGGGILALIIIGVIVYFLIKYFNQNKNNSNDIRNNKAIEILRERYASGEISEEEYTKKLNKLNE